MLHMYSNACSSTGVICASGLGGLSVEAIGSGASNIDLQQ